MRQQCGKGKMLVKEGNMPIINLRQLIKCDKIVKITVTKE